MLIGQAGPAEPTNTLERLNAIMLNATSQLWEISDADASRAPKAGAWSPKQELGHLVDSAVNNYARIIRVQRESAPALPHYEQDAWVERRGYAEDDWKPLVMLWVMLNRHLLAAARKVPGSALARTCTIGGGSPITLDFLIEDYVDHIVHHLQHIGIELQKFRRAGSAYA